jgi:hypothetical protein
MYGREEVQENILDLIPQPQSRVRKEKMYRSKYNPQLPPTGSTFVHNSKVPAGAGVGLEIARPSKLTARNFGKPIGTCKPDPGAFLKKRQNQRQVAARKPASRGKQKENRKPTLPSRKDAPVMGLQSTKNYVTANAVEAILAVPGNRARVQPQQPQYRHKQDFGRVPAYLDEVKGEIARENRMIEEYLGVGDAAGNQGEDEVVPDSEIRTIVNQLKEKWDKTNARYQRLTHQTKLDTIGKLRRKEGLEKELEQIEKDIRLIEGRKVQLTD